MPKKKVEPKNKCHLCEAQAVLYFDYKFWCVKCGSDPLTEYSKKIKCNINNLSEEKLNNIF